MEKAIKCRHSKKLQNYKITENRNIEDKDTKKRKNQNFSKKELLNKKSLKGVRHKNNYRETIHPPKVNQSDQNAINLS